MNGSKIPADRKAPKTSLPAGLTVRAATWGDLEAVLALMNAVDVAAYGEPDSDLEDLRASWEDLNLEADTWIVESRTGELRGYAAVFPDAPEVTLDFLTHPENKVRGLVQYLLGCCQRRAHQLRSRHDGLPVRANTIIPHVHQSERRLLTAAGFHPRKYYFQMLIELQEPPPAPDLPEGLAFRAFNPGADVLATYEFLQKAFDRPGYQRPPFEQWREFMVASRRFDPGLWFLLVKGPDIVGAVLSYDYGDLGWVRQLGVAPAWRRQGLGAALLKQAFAVFYARGRHRVALGVSAENPTAIGLYKRVGMRIFRRYDEYVKELAA